MAEVMDTDTVQCTGAGRAGARRRRSRRRVRALAVVGVVVASVTAATGSAASAKSWSQTGAPGQVAVTPTVTADGAARRLTVHASAVGEAPGYAAYDQYVCLTSRLWQIVYSPAWSPPRPFWQQVSSYRRCGWIPAAGTAITDAGNSFAAGYQKGYAVTMEVTWQLANGATIGTKTVQHNAVGDYRCVNGNCTVNNTNWGGGAFVFFPGY